MEKISISDRVIKTEPFKWREFQFIQSNDFKEISGDAKKKLRNSILKNHFVQPCYAWHDEKTQITYCLDGKHRSDTMRELESEGVQVPELLPTTFIRCKDINEAARLVLLYSSIYAKVQHEGLLDFIEGFGIGLEELNDTIDLPEVDMLDIEAKLNGADIEKIETAKSSLAEKFIVPPFSILDTRQHYWQERKRVWHTLMNSQETREDVELIAKSGQSTHIYELRNEMRAKLNRDPDWDEILTEAKKRKLHVYEGASVFDPVLCELSYEWFCKPGGTILDPFAGGSVRGIVAGLTGRDYFGIDLRQDQVDSNAKQWEELKDQRPNKVEWVCSDSDKFLDNTRKQANSEQVFEHMFDMVFSCPPYFDLEKYSDDPDDLSNMDTGAFCRVYERIILNACDRLKENSFAVFVVGEVREKTGQYKSFVPITIEAFQRAGLHYYNEMILVNVAGSLAIRAGGAFSKSRKIGKMHQNVLVFWKGDPSKVKDIVHDLKIENNIDNWLAQ